MTVPGRPHLVTTPTARGHVVGFGMATYPPTNTGSAGGQSVAHGTSFVPDLWQYSRRPPLENSPDRRLQIVGQTRFVERQVRARVENGLVHVVAYAG